MAVSFPVFYSEMSRPLRFIPADSLVEVTSRTLEGRMFLTPSRELNTIIQGSLVCAASAYNLEIHAYAFLSNHFHLLVTARDARQLAAFMGHFKARVAREINRLRGRRDTLWGRRYSAIVVSHEEAAQVARLRYILSQGCKEGLVARPEEWPGIHAARTLAQGPNPRLAGEWIDRTALWRKGPHKGNPQQRGELRLAPLPAWAGLPPEQIHRRVKEMLLDIEQETRCQHRRHGTRPLGAAAVQQAPFDRVRLKRRPSAPRFHAFAAGERLRLEIAFAAFTRAFRKAAERLRQGQRAVFPPGSFPPALPFVGEAVPLIS